MIFIDRSLFPNPLDPDPALGQRALEENRRAVEFYESPRGGQYEFDFKVFKSDQVKSALMSLFNGKCAYCESPLITSHGDIEQYRPKRSVVEEPGHRGYFWLINEWTNLLIACEFCNRAGQFRAGTSGRNEITGKGNRFPISGMRAFRPDGVVLSETEKAIRQSRCWD